MRRRLALLSLALLVLAGVALWLWLRHAPLTPPTMPLSGEPAEPLASQPASPRAVLLARTDGGSPGSRATDAVIRTSDGGAAASAPMDPTELGRLVALGQDYALGEALATNAQNADRYVDRLCDEAQKLSARPTMPTPGAGKRDAAELMAPLMDYEKPLHDPPGRLHLSEERRKRLADYGNAWMVKITDRDLEGLDFAWLSSLAAFDHWTLLGAGPLRDQSFSDFFTSPIPNYGVLQQWAKLRYAAGLRRGDLPAASAEVRHLADLVRSQRILIAEMVAVALYRLDARAREIAAASGADLSTWPAVDPAQLDRQRRLGFASMYFTYPGVSPETLRKAVRCMSAPCSALVEGVGAHRAFGAYGMTDNLALLAQLAQEQGCESAVFERVRNSREVPAGEALEALSSEVDRQLPKLLGSPH